MIDQIVTGFFNEWITDSFQAKPEIRRYLLQHERKAKCIASVIEQVRMAELSNIGQRLNIRRIKWLTEVGAEIFAKAALEWAEQQALSSAEKQRRIDKENEYENLKEDLIDRDILVAEIDKPEKKVCR